MASLELYRRSIAGSAVATFGVVEHLDVVEDIGPCVVASPIGLAANAFTFEQLEETLSHSVVVTVAATAHAGYEVVIA